MSQLIMRRRIVPYRGDLKERAHELRTHMTLAEVLLWKRLKGKQLCGYDFDRQKPVGRRIVGSYCKELALAVDVDGSVHGHTREQDERRHKEIEALGVTHLRFWNYDAKNDLGSGLKRIEDWIRVEEQKCVWPRREPPVKLPRSRAMRRSRPTPDPSEGGELRNEGQMQIERSKTVASPITSPPPRRGQGWVGPKEAMPPK